MKIYNNTYNRRTKRYLLYFKTKYIFGQIRERCFFITFEKIIETKIFEKKI